MMQLYMFTDKFKRSKVKEIPDSQARNLVAQMLTKDPSKRPSLAQIKLHPFFTGGKVARLTGETAVFDVFISYRVQSDLALARMIYDKLVAAGIKVWFDKECLKPGENWQVSIGHMKNYLLL